MKTINFQVIFEDNSYMFEKNLGLLLKKKCVNKNVNKPSLHPKVIEALKLNHNPYTLKQPSKIENITIHKSTFMKLYISLLTLSCKIAFSFARIFYLFRIPTFENATESIIFFRNSKKGIIQDDLCLPRSLFAAITSKIFKEKGVIFIGVSLPSKTMHAWIIEDNKQPDPFDSIWINFHPVAAIY